MSLVRSCLTLVFYWYAAVASYRLTMWFGQGKLSKKDKKLMVIIGSGGHTTEMLLMLQTLNPQNYGALHFIVGHSDTWSLTKMNDFLQTQAKHRPLTPNQKLEVGKPINNMQIHKVFRSREVKQSYITSVATTLWAIAHAFLIVARTRPDLIVTNGPGTAVPICWANFVL